MGEYSDDVLEGRSCHFCGLFFTEEHGYPVICEECFEQSTKEEISGLPKAIHPLIGKRVVDES